MEAALKALPRSHERGSVEAGQGSTHQAGKRDLPRSHERGSVEAHRPPGGPRRVRGTFHAHTSAAPLKLFRGAEDKAMATALPRSHERGSVEARR